MMHIALSAEVAVVGKRTLLTLAVVFEGRIATSPNRITKYNHHITNHQITT